MDKLFIKKIKLAVGAAIELAIVIPANRAMDDLGEYTSAHIALDGERLVIHVQNQMPWRFWTRIIHE